LLAGGIEQMFQRGVGTWSPCGSQQLGGEFVAAEDAAIMGGAVV
jgi:hypothetical protein